MAKYRRFRKYTRRNRGRWSSNIKNIEDIQSLNLGVNGNSVDLCLNPLQNDLTVSQQFTVKNIELSVFAEVSDNSPAVESIEHYIMFVPQGMNLTVDYNIQHPEYIMAYYYQGNPISETSVPNLGYKLKIKTRMARRLQTGDRIIYFWKATNTSDTNITIDIRGLVRWWTKAN